MATAAVGKKPAENVSASNVIHDPTQSLQTFDLLHLQQYTQEKVYAELCAKVGDGMKG
jgi:hypothetical protein